MYKTKNIYFLDNTFFLFIIPDGDLENHDVSQLSQETLDTIEADTFWCMSKLLDGIQVHGKRRL